VDTNGFHEKKHVPPYVRLASHINGTLKRRTPSPKEMNTMMNIETLHAEIRKEIEHSTEVRRHAERTIELMNKHYI